MAAAPREIELKDVQQTFEISAHELEKLNEERSQEKLKELGGIKQLAKKLRTDLRRGLDGTDFAIRREQFVINRRMTL